MTRDEIIDKCEHTFAGMVLDAWAHNRTGDAQALFGRQIQPKVRFMLENLFNDAVRHCMDEQAKLTKPAGGGELFEKKGRGKNGD